MEQGSQKHTIGILGGMGPAASAEFYRRIVSIAQHEYGADQDTDFPPMHLYSLPLFGFDETGFVDAGAVQKQLVEGAERLAASGSDFIVIPCNTVHAFYEDMQAAVSVPIISIIDAVADAVVAGGHTTVGLLSSDSTRKYGLYETALKKRTVDVLSADEKEQEIVNGIIHHVMAGVQDAADIDALKTIISRFHSLGASAVVLGCTELPLAIAPGDVETPLLNSIDILAHAALTRAYGKK